MICEICKKKMEKPSTTPQEAMKKFSLKLKLEKERRESDKKRKNKKRNT